ncbi:hypothetical protein Tco_1029263 [Tanacetum coccineum]|uniref:Uncharacterized protein n=1 Tax=Tanacetum coccineum TaxID=301880 RepID=A0ABQ5G2Y8_9ASTR
MYRRFWRGGIVRLLKFIPRLHLNNAVVKKEVVQDKGKSVANLHYGAFCKLKEKNTDGVMGSGYLPMKDMFVVHIEHGETTERGFKRFGVAGLDDWERFHTIDLRSICGRVFEDRMDMEVSVALQTRRLIVVNTNVRDGVSCPFLCDFSWSIRKHMPSDLKCRSEDQDVVRLEDDGIHSLEQPLFEFADTYKGAYSDNTNVRDGVCPFYCYFDGYQEFGFVPLRVAILGPFILLNLEIQAFAQQLGDDDVGMYH